MQYYECKCGKSQFFGSGMSPARCFRCRDCGTNCLKQEPTLHDFYKESVETDDGPATLSRCRMCLKTKAQIAKIERKPVLGLDFGNTIRQTSTGELVLGLPFALPKIKDFFGEEVYIISRVHDLEAGEKDVRAYMQRYGLYQFIPEDHLNFCLLREEKAPIAERLKITHFVDDRTECLHHMRIPHKYAIKPNEKQLEDFPPYDMKVVQDWYDTIREIEKDLD